MEIEFLERLLKEPEGETKISEPDKGEIAVSMHDKDEMFLTFIELSECFEAPINNVVVGMEDNTNKYDAEIREIEKRLFEDEMKYQEQQESYFLRDMKETKVLIQQDKDGRNQQFKRDDQQHESKFEEGIRLQEYSNWQQNEEHEISLAVVRVEVDILTEWLQRKTNED